MVGEKRCPIKILPPLGPLPAFSSISPTWVNESPDDNTNDPDEPKGAVPDPSKTLPVACDGAD